MIQGAIGELDASSRHLKGIQSAVKEWNRVVDPVPTLPQRMLKMLVLLKDYSANDDVC